MKTSNSVLSKLKARNLLVLALAGLLAPATTSAVTCDGCIGEETIPVEGEAPEAPWTPPNYDGHDGGGGGGGGPIGEGGGGPSGGESEPMGESIGPDGLTDTERVKSERQECITMSSTQKTKWSTANFKDYTTGVVYSGYSCRYPQEFWHYFDSKGYFNKKCYYYDPGKEIIICDPERGEPT